jgi:hypothetical protein
MSETAASVVTDGDELLEDHPFDSADPRRGGWARVEVHREVHYGYVREVQVFHVTRCEILIPFCDRPGVQFVKSYRGRDIFTIEPSTRDFCMLEAPRELDDEDAP